jgi:hypothetical protein
MPETEPSASPKRVKFHIRGSIDEDWVSWFDGMDLETNEGESPSSRVMCQTKARCTGSWPGCETRAWNWCM